MLQFIQKQLLIESVKSLKIIAICFLVISTNDNGLAQINFTGLTGYNYIYSKTYLLKTSSGTDYRESMQYFDGFARINQTIDYKGSPAEKDLIQPIEYDNFGRETNKYLPYASTAVSGAYRSSWKIEQASFYTTTLAYGSTDGNKAFATSVFDNSPLNRLMKQGAPGDAWKIVSTAPERQSSEHVISYQYSSNKGYVVYYWTITGTYPNITFTRNTYVTNSLFKNVIRDENNNPVTEYKDKQGKVILKTDALGGKTYYVYDELELLRCVLPPLASSLVSATSFTITSTTFKELGYYYEYDARHRMIIKQIPGNNGSYTMVYDNLDRLIETTDPKATRSYVDYDLFSRPVETGIYEANIKTWKVKTIYDTYVSRTDYSIGYPYQNVYYSSRETAVKGKTTVTITKVINPASGMKTELVTITYYDKYGRIIQVQSDNHLGGRDIISHYYKYKNSDLIEKTKHQHWKTSYSGNANQTVEEIFTYDTGGRLKTTDHVLNGTTLRVSSMAYAEDGKLKTKTIENSFQTIDFRYNIRGWLTQMNNPYVYSSTKRFALQLSYTEGSYNGNITRMEWNNCTGGSLVSRYDLHYDQLNRMTVALYSEYNNGIFLPASMDKYTSVVVNYDANGNILCATNYGDFEDGTSLTGTIDYLNYAYYNGGKSNKLYAVGDYVPDIYGRGDFNESTSDGYATQEYNYDANGNMTFDKNRRTNIAYNFLNLPEYVHDGLGHDIFKYIYNAVGMKMRQQSFLGTATTFDYIGRFVYKNDVLDHIITPEGRAVFTNGTFSYHEFHLKDHLGNIRTVLKRNGSTVQILQVNNYYPFGMLMGAPLGETYSNKYRYNGKENLTATSSTYGVDVSWYDYGARFYDPQIGRWHSVDPLAEVVTNLSPYQYGYNNPVKFVDINGMYSGEAGTYKPGDPEWEEVLSYWGVGTNTNNSSENESESGDNPLQASINAGQAAFALYRIIEPQITSREEGDFIRPVDEQNAILKTINSFIIVSSDNPNEIIYLVPVGNNQYQLMKISMGAMMKILNEAGPYLMKGAGNSSIKIGKELMKMSTRKIVLPNKIKVPNPNMTFPKMYGGLGQGLKFAGKAMNVWGTINRYLNVTPVGPQQVTLGDIRNQTAQKYAELFTE